MKKRIKNKIEKRMYGVIIRNINGRVADYMSPDKMCWVRRSVDVISEDAEYVEYYITTEIEDYLGNFVEVEIGSGDVIGNKSVREDSEVYFGNVVACCKYINNHTHKSGICNV